MNLLRIQDALKDASDQQLMQMMQAPDSTAPSYLVLSEIRRRKDMRAKQAPEGESRRTVAEDLMGAPEEAAGIRGLQPQMSPQSQMDPDGVDAAGGGDAQGMAAGGIVRMQEGGTPPEDEEIPPPPPDAPPVPRAADGIGALAPIQTERAATMAEIMRRNEELFPNAMGGIRERMREERVDPAARRNEAVNMALIEAGLRIAGSRNPSLIGAIGEGALPAVQGYGQQLGQIRTEQRQARQDELELAKQEVNRQFAIGQISAAEHRNTISELGANARLRHQLAAEAIRSERANAAQAAIADRQAAAQTSITNRAIQIEEMRERRNREAAERQEEARARAAIAADVTRQLQTPGAMDMLRAQLRAQRIRENPSERNPVVRDEDVENYLLGRALRARQAALQYSLPGSAGAGGAGPVLNYDPATGTVR